MHKYDATTGFEATLEREVADLKLKNEELKTNMALMTDEIAKLDKAYTSECYESTTWKQAWREQKELVALRNDQIAMLERRLYQSKLKNPYPFKEGDLYYVFNQLDGTWIESVWDDESERLHDSSKLPDHPHKVYFTLDQKHVLDKFKPEDD
jgi:predicted RNase H-like nuclease (RuvC/YqgF family)